MYGAQERTRTSTTVRPLAPEASASASSATWAQVQKKEAIFILRREVGFVNEAAGGAGGAGVSEDYRLADVVSLIPSVSFPFLDVSP